MTISNHVENAAAGTSVRSGSVRGMLRRTGTPMALGVTAFFSLAAGSYMMAAEQGYRCLINKIVVPKVDCRGEPDGKLMWKEGSVLSNTTIRWSEGKVGNLSYGRVMMVGAQAACKVGVPEYTTFGSPAYGRTHLKPGDRVSIFRVMRRETPGVYIEMEVLPKGKKAPKTSK